MKSKGELTKGRILAEATRLVRRKGFEATSINDLMAVTGLKKGCLYFHFSGKEELSLAILEKAKADFFASFDSSLAGKTPGDRLDHFLEETLEQSKKKEFEAGCIFGNTALEMSGKNQRLSKFVGEVFAEWIERISKVVKDAQEAGQVRKDLSAAILARHIVMSLEGGIMLTRLEKSEKPMKDCITSLRTLLGMKK
jgi:TetR/AcrR family transcriptional repressor of nem operon